MEKDLADWRRSAIVLGLVAEHLYMLAGVLIAYGLRGRLDDESLAEIRAQAVLNLKNMGAMGLPIEEEAVIVGQAIKQFEEFIDAAIVEGREAKES